ncbi:MAG: hypothetical protein R6U98_06545 [Pirellulaceae bacterium]
MRTAIIAIVALGAVVTGVVLTANGKTRTIEEDRAVADQVMKAKTAEELADAPEPDVVHGPPALTPQAVEAIIEDLKDIEGNGGLLKIGRRHGASMSQVKAVMASRDARIRELSSHEVDGEVIEP